MTICEITPTILNDVIRPTKTESWDATETRVPVHRYWDDILSHFPDDFWRNLSSNKARTD